jgi:hypothetical protein
MWLMDGRPRCGSRAAFVTLRQPIRPLTPEAVRQIVPGLRQGRAERRGAHRFRHALATEMLRPARR